MQGESEAVGPALLELEATVIYDNDKDTVPYGSPP